MNALPSIAIALAAALVSGCIGLEGSSDLPSPPESTAKKISARQNPGNGTVDANEASQVQTQDCGAYVCATKTHWISGGISLDAWPVNLASFNGDVEVVGGAGGTWNLTVALHARGDSDATARSNLDNIEFRWSLARDGDRALEAQARKKQQNTRNQESAEFHLTVPASVVLDLSASTTNGAASARGVQADEIHLTTTNGGVTARDLTTHGLVMRSTNGEARVTTVTADSISVATSNGEIGVSAAAGDFKLQTTNGEIQAKLRPTRSGTIEATTTNGPISVELPETAEHGHDVTAATTNGAVSIELEDGTTSGSSTRKTFKSHGYGERDIRTKTTITSTNAVVEVEGF